MKSLCPTAAKDKLIRQGIDRLEVLMSDGTAKKRDPEKWERAKAKARKKHGRPLGSSHAARRQVLQGCWRHLRRQESPRTTSFLAGQRGLADREEYEKKKKK